MILRFTVPGHPIGKARPRHTKGGHTYTPKKTRDYEKAVAFAAKGAMAFSTVAGDGDPSRHYTLVWPMDATYRVSIHAYCKNGVRSDCDNILKAALDGMQGVVYDNDKSVTRAEVTVATDRENPRLEVEVEVMT